MKMTKEVLAIMQGNEWLHSRNLKLQNELDEKKARIVQLQDEIFELKSANASLEELVFGSKISPGFASKKICVRGMYYIRTDECEKLNNTIKELKRRLEQVKVVASGSDDNY